MKKYNKMTLFIAMLMIILVSFTSTSAFGASTFNSVQIKGETKTPDTTAVSAWFYDSSGNIWLSTGTTAPSSEEGFSVGAIFLDTDASGSSIFLINQGTTSSCNFASGSATTTFLALTDTPGSIVKDTYYKGNSAGNALDAGIVIGTPAATSGYVLGADGTDWDAKSPDDAGLVDKSSTQTSIGGVKTWSAAQTYSSTSSFQGTLTTVGTVKIVLNAATEYLYSSAAGIVNLAANTELQMDSALFDINAGANGFDLDSTGTIALTGTKNATASVYIHANGGTSETLKIHSDLGNTEDSITVLSDAGGINVDAATAKDVDIAGGQVKLVSKDNATGAISATTNVGSTETMVFTNTKGSNEAAVSLIATAGGVNIDANAGKNITLDGGQILVTALEGVASAFAVTLDAGVLETMVFTNTQGTDEASIEVTSTDGGIDLNANAGKNITIDGGQILVTALENCASAFAVTLNAGALETIVFTNTQGADEAAVSIMATAGGINIDANAGKNITIDGGQILVTALEGVASAFAVTLDTGILETMVFTNTQGTDEAAVSIIATAGGINIDAASDKDVDIAGGQINLTSSHDTADSIKISSDGGVSETIAIESVQGANEYAIKLTSTAGGIDLNAHAGKNITLDGGQILVTTLENCASAFAVTLNKGILETMVFTNTLGTDEAAISLIATAGGVNIDANAGKNITLDGGQILVTTLENCASAFAVTLNKGILETMVFTNTLGTDEAAISLIATAGGVNIDASATKNATIDAGQILLTAAHNVSETIYLHANAGTSETIKIHSDLGNTDTSVHILSDAGGIHIEGQKVQIKGSATFGTYNYGHDVGAADDDYTVDFSPALAAYTEGMVIYLRVDFDNAAGCTLDINSVGPLAIKTQTGVDPANADIDATGVAMLIHNGTHFVLMNPATTCD